MARGPAVTWRLVIDTATRRTVVAVGRGRTLVAVDVLDAPDRHGAQLMSRLTAVLTAAGIGMSDITAIGVGTGPGSFTGLRVGLATAKTLAAVRHLPLVGLPTDELLREAASGTLGVAESADAAVLLPAGARDHYLGLAGSDPSLVPPGTDIAALIGDRPVLAVDIPSDAAWLVPLRERAAGRGDPDPLDAGRAACEGLPAALLASLDARLARGDVADVATLVPRYVGLPRGISVATATAADSIDPSGAGEGTWSPGFH